MRPLEHILYFDPFTALLSEGKDPHSFVAGWKTCVMEVEKQILQDYTTTKDNIREKARNYVLNYLAVTPELSGLDRDKLIEDIADEIEDDLKDYSFPKTPPAALIAQREREKIPEDPEKRFIRLRP